MSLSRDSKQERIWKAVRRAQFSLQQRIERIEWEESELIPEIAAIKAGKATAMLPEGAAIEIVIDRANHRPNES
jgi:hypothetical protein